MIPPLSPTGWLIVGWVVLLLVLDVSAYLGTRRKKMRKW